MSQRFVMLGAAPRRVAGVLAALATCGGVVACTGDDRAGRQPLGSSAVAATPPANASADVMPSEGSKLPLAALTALEAGNTAYREKRLDEALAQYERASAAAPAHAAPWFGIYMAAVELKNSTLADSAMRRVKALSADPAALDAHATVTSPNNGLSGAGALPPGHPSSSTPALPPGHPTATPALPPGHPTSGVTTPSTGKKM